MRFALVIIMVNYVVHSVLEVVWRPKSVVPNLFCAKVYFSSNHYPEIYQLSVNITNLFTSHPACSK